MFTPEVYHEKTPLAETNCFVVFDRIKSTFSFPVHVHPEYELNFVDGALGARRIVGDSVENIGEKDLVLIANKNLKHAWENGACTSTKIHEITLQFHPSLIEPHFDKTQFRSIQKLITRASRGLCFGAVTIEKVQPLLQLITMENDGFHSVMRLFVLLYELSKSEDYRALAKNEVPELDQNAVQLKTLQDYVERNISENIRIDEVAYRLNMSRSTFARFIKAHTGESFSGYILQSRINMAVQRLKGKMPIPNIAVECGFNSLSYFYRVFKKEKGVTPYEFRTQYKTSLY